jgi:hypothetical protein
MANVACLATDAAKTAHERATQLLAARQVKPGDKLPLKEKVKETDASKPFSLAPTGKNIFVCRCLFPPRSRPPWFSLSLAPSPYTLFGSK